jgi:GT2 family glycosyltransferase
VNKTRGGGGPGNAGIARARGAILAFIDDDVVPADDWLRSVVRAFEAEPGVDCIGGRVEPRWPAQVPKWVTPRHFAPLAIQLNRPPTFDAAHASSCLITANFACRRSVFAEVGTFATTFRRDEDREFNLRLWRAGKRGRFVDQVRVMAPVAAERLRKSYHRRWYETTGVNHARMRYREIIDHEGRLVEPMQGRRLFGVPLFVYKECLVSAARWAGHVMRGDLAEAFYHECQARYLLSYIRTRAKLLHDVHA